MAEYVEREALLKMALQEKRFVFRTVDMLNSTEEFVVQTVYKDLFEAVEKIPKADVVEVVRCKDCKHWKNRKDVAGNIICSAVAMKIHTESYCSYGERKNDNA